MVNRHMLRLMLVLGVILATVFGVGPIVSMAAAPPALTFPGTLTAEEASKLLIDGTEVIIGCGQCEKLTVTDITLCPPASTISQIMKNPVIDNITICEDHVLVNAHVDKFIFYIDVSGNPRVRFIQIPVDCCIEIPGILPTDTVANQVIAVVCEYDELRNDGKILHEKMCTRINVSIQRNFPDPLATLH